ncbi:MAG: hypothetical protein IJL25_07270 [Clostridia bacterium]|nr:hypothetical protein [Clostridia bacterium]
MRPNEIRPAGRVKSPAAVKSLRGEIRLKADGRIFSPFGAAAHDLTEIQAERKRPAMTLSDKPESYHGGLLFYFVTKRSFWLCFLFSGVFSDGRTSLRKAPRCSAFF